LLSVSRHMLFKLLSPPYYLKKISPFSFNNALRLKICYVSCECPFSQRWQPHVSLFYMKQIWIINTYWPIVSLLPLQYLPLS
jgi:hypothetical protein